jgi:ATP-dependent RNA helicase DDX23/PRP28
MSNLSTDILIFFLGRTGRAGKFGVATTFVTESDTEVMYDLKNYLESTDTPVPHQLAKVIIFN